MKNYVTDTEKIKNLKAKLQEFMGELSDGDYIALAKELSGANREAEVHFSQAAYYKMYALINGIDKEIAWDGICVRDEEHTNVFYVTDIIVYPQMVASATVETDDEKYLDWMNGLDDEIFNHRRFNGHSHVNMGTSPSATDMTYREESLKNVKDFFVFGIFNKKGEFNFEVYDIENNIVYENKDIVFYTPEPDYSDWAKAQIKDKISEKKYTTTVVNNGRTYGTGGYNYNGKPNPSYGNGYSQQNMSDYYREMYGGYYGD